MDGSADAVSSFSPQTSSGSSRAGPLKGCIIPLGPLGETWECHTQLDTAQEIGGVRISWERKKAGILGVARLQGNFQGCRGS